MYNYHNQCAVDEEQGILIPQPKSNSRSYTLESVSGVQVKRFPRAYAYGCGDMHYIEGNEDLEGLTYLGKRFHENMYKR